MAEDSYASKGIPGSMAGTGTTMLWDVAQKQIWHLLAEFVNQIPEILRSIKPNSFQQIAEIA